MRNELICKDHTADSRTLDLKLNRLYVCDLWNLELQVSFG